MPDLGLVLPTLRPIGTPTGTITATPGISTTAIVAFFSTIEVGISTPAAGVRTVTAGYSWQSGAAISATSVTIAGPALTWMSVLNPGAAIWTTEGGPLWAIAPFVMPVLPIVAIMFVVLIARFALWLLGWLLKLLDVIFKLIELIPGE
jgi:hypothetical protein